MTIAFTIICFSVPIVALISFYYGFKVAKDIYSFKDISSESVPFKAEIQQIFEKATETDEERKARIRNTNIENYGTGAAQIDIK